MVTVAPPPKYQRRHDRPRPARATPAPSPARSRSRSATPGGPPRCKHCNAATLAHEEGGVVCQTCGIINEEDSNFRAEIEFDESSSGAVKTRGTHVGAHQTHQRTFANRVGQAAHVGQEATKASERATSDALHKMQHFASFLRIRDAEVDRAMYIFDQAYHRQFYRGRTLESVAIVCLYLAIRQCLNRDRYALMLIDFAELSQGYYNVFELGKMAKALQDLLFLDPGRDRWWHLENQKQRASGDELRQLNEQQDGIYRGRDLLSLQDPEDLIERFCEKLDFGDKTFVVKRDAAKIAQSMNRDWMVTGRRPAGIAGAAVIIAARMNNYRRTLREVVLVAKVTEITLSKRIEEFKETTSSTMSVKDFRATDPNGLQTAEAQNPPAYYRALPEWQQKQAQKKRKRKRKTGVLKESAAAIENDTDEQTETETEDASGDEAQDADQDQEQDTITNLQSTEKRPRVDADGFAVPDLPTRSAPASQPQPEDTQSSRRRAGKPKGAKNWTPRPPTAEEEQDERNLERDIQEQLTINANLDPTGSIVRESVEPETPLTLIDVHDMPSPPSRATKGPAVDSTTGNTDTIPMTETLGDDEFEDDPDVANCLLNEAERAFKETVWVEENKDWLRTEHAKRIKRELKDRELREKGIDPDKERMKKLRRKDGMQRAGRTGDISYLEEAKRRRAAGGEDSQNQQQNGKLADRVEASGSAANNNGNNNDDDDEAHRRSVSIEARGSVQVMMQQRGTFSRRVDYNKLSQAYVLPGFEDSSESRSESPALPTPAPSANTNAAASASAADSFYRPHISRGTLNSNRRRAKATATRIAGVYDTENETDADRESPVRRSRSASGLDREVGGEEERGEEAEGVEVGQLPTPVATQGPAMMPMGGVRSRDASDSPLSSTHTPAGLGSGAPNTPMAGIGQAGKKGAGGEEDEDDEESEGDEDDYVDDDDDEGDEGENLDRYFGAGGGGEQMMGEAEEVIDDDGY